MPSPTRPANTLRVIFARLRVDQRGLGSSEAVLLLVVIVALAVSVWNLFGNDVACRLAYATGAFDDGKHPGASQCREPTSTGSGNAAITQGSQGGQSGAGSAGHGGFSSAGSSGRGAAAASTPPANVTTQAASPGVLLASAPSQPASITDRIATALSTVSEHAVDLTEGAIAGAFPLSPAIPPGQLKPTFGHEITYGVGQTVASLGGLVYDAGLFLSGGAGAVGSVLVTVASDGTLIVVTGPAFAESVAIAGTGVAMMPGHMSNLKDGVNHMTNGSGAQPEARPHPSEESAAVREPSEPSPAQRPPEPTPTDPPNGGGKPRFVTDGQGQTVDLEAFRGLTPNPEVVKAGRSGAGKAFNGPPNSFSKTSGGHALVYGSDGRLMYDVSPERIKAVQWNRTPNGQLSPRTGSDLKFKQVPSEILDNLGLQ